MSAAPQRVITSAMEEFRGYDAAAAAEDCTAPALYVAADESQPRGDMARSHELCSQKMYSKIVGSGHFCQREAPEQVNPMIERFLTIALPG
jgi:pimeloyl-ACP methyl ester carboxylesterase